MSTCTCLRGAQLAQDDSSPQQAADYLQAESFLYAKNADGTVAGPGAALTAYNQYQQAYLMAEQGYKAAQLTAMASGDPAVQNQWQTIDEPKLRAQLDAAETAWDTKGFKAQVVSAQQIEQAYVAQSPALQWKTWLSECNPDIDFLTDSDNQSFGPTAYAPYDICEKGGWPSFTLSSTEIQQLASQAPPELKNVFNDQQSSRNDVAGSVVSSGQGTLRGTWMFSFDAGRRGGLDGTVRRLVGPND